MNSSRPQSGNILFLILLAVVLFAALSYAVTSGMRGGGKDASAESGKSSASAMMQAGTLMENSLARMMLSNGCKESEISFEDPYDTGYVNNARADGSCKLFGDKGGNVEYPVPDTKWLNTSHSAKTNYGKWVFFNITCVPFIGTGVGNCGNNGTNADSDLVAFLPYVTKQVCQAVNDTIGVPATSDGDVQIEDANTDIDQSWYKYTGTFAGAGGTDAITGSTTSGGNFVAFYHKSLGCFKRSPSVYSSDNPPVYVFYYVILAR